MADLAKAIIAGFWLTLGEMSPYLLFGFGVAGILSALVSQEIVEKHLGGPGIRPLLKASVLGVPLPLCSCGVIPVSMSLHKHGAGKGPTIAFLLSTPQTGVDSIFATLSLLGPVFAIFRPVAALITGLVGGSLVQLLDPSPPQTPDEKCTEQCCKPAKPAKKVLSGLKYAFVTLPRDIAKPMLLGLVIAALISALVPGNFFADKLGAGLFAMVVMMFLGIPVYVCATASIPVAAALMLKGLTPGAALVFLMTGPATNAASFVTIWKTLGRKTALIYLGTVAGCALAAGIILDFIAGGVDFNIVSTTAKMLPQPLKHLSAVALLLVLTTALLTKRAGPHK